MRAGGLHSIEYDRAAEFPLEGQPRDKLHQLLARLKGIVRKELLQRWNRMKKVVAVNDIVGEHWSLSLLRGLDLAQATDVDARSSVFGRKEHVHKSRPDDHLVVFV